MLYNSLSLSTTQIFSMSSSSSVAKVCEDGHEVVLPGFRFHPTDEELVGFYLRRKVNKKQLRMELIRETDIYKYDPWDLPNTSDEGDKEWYFFCKRGRKYRNSIRPNRVTASGFWKATGIDRPVYSHGGEGHDCIGLKKTLVYYRGSAGKGTKTDWMMHEFRLPNSVSGNNNNNNVVNNITTQPNNSPANQEAEIWTLCRIFKRNVSHRKYTPDWREMAAKNRGETSSNIILKPYDNDTASECYINFGAPMIDFNTPESVMAPHHSNHQLTMHGGVSHDQMSTSSVTPLQPSTMSSSSFSDADVNDDHQFFADRSNWDELRSVVEFALDL